MAQPNPPTPTCKAILLCDDTIIEAGTGKISLIGIFQRFTLRSMPGTTKPVRLFVQLTNAAGRYDFVIDVRDLQNDELIAQAPGMGIQINDRLQFCNLVIPVPPLPIHHDGSYDFIVFANGQEIDRQTFTVVYAPPEGDQDADPNR